MSKEEVEELLAEREIKQLRKRYLATMHAVQSGVAAKMDYDPSETEPKHLRTGVNAAMVSHGALARLLIARGVITEREYTEALVKQAEEEKALYEAELSEHFGRKVTLG